LLNIKLKGPHFDIIKVMEAESQAVLKTLTEHNFQDAFKKWPKHWEGYMGAGEATKPNVSSSPDGSISLGNYGYQW
jgi:hypothetical protein